MRIWDIYHLAIEMGIESDPRGREAVEALLEELRESYAELPAKECAACKAASGRSSSKLTHQ